MKLGQRISVPPITAYNINAIAYLSGLTMQYQLFAVLQMRQSEINSIQIAVGNNVE